MSPSEAVRALSALIPARRPVYPTRLAEEEMILNRLPDGEFDHERYAVRALLRRVGRPARAARFESAAGLTRPFYWLGALRLSLPDMIKPGREFRKRPPAVHRRGPPAAVFGRVILSGWSSNRLSARPPG